MASIRAENVNNYYCKSLAKGGLHTMQTGLSVTAVTLALMGFAMGTIVTVQLMTWWLKESYLWKGQ